MAVCWWQGVESMWRVGCVHLSQTRASPVSISIGINHKLRISSLPNAKTRACIVSMASTSKSDNAVSQPQLSSLSSSSAASLPPFVNAVKNPPELALLSVLFVLSAAMGAIFSLAIISIPTTIAFKKLGDSADKLSKTVSEEVPGTLSSLKLSGLELNDLTQQLTNLRHKISGAQYAKKSRSNKPSSSASRNYPIAD